MLTLTDDEIQHGQKEPTKEAVARIIRLLAGDAAVEFIDQEKVVERSQEWERLCGIYFLIDSDEIVYVGQSTNIYSRIAQHHEKQFDRFSYFKCDASALNFIESVFIHTYRPKLNSVRVAGYLAAPVSMSDIKRTALAYHYAMAGSESDGAKEV